MAKIYMNLRGSLSSGGPTIAAARLEQGFRSNGHVVTFDKPNRADVCLCIIESGKVLRQINRKKTKVVVRLDGAYYKGYWHSKTPDRQWRPDMTALHNAIIRDVKNVDHMIYQSAFSKKMIDTEIACRNNNFSIIHNGVDPKIFVPRVRNKDGFINLFHHGVIRNDYIMRSLIGVYSELKKRGKKVRLVIVGKMDGECSKIYSKYKLDSNIQYLGPVSNSKLSVMFAHADIGVYPRCGSSNDNSIIESIMSGVPVVIPSFGGNNELIFSEQSGIIISRDGWGYNNEYIIKMADGVEEISKDLDGFQMRARKHAVKNLTIDNMVNKYLIAMGF